MTGFLHSNNLIIGLGGTGGRVLRDMRKHLFENYGTIPPEVAFLYIDSSEELIHHNDPSWMTKDGQDAQFNPCETLLLSPIPADSLSSSPEYYPALKEIAKNCRHMNYRGQGAMQDRRLGRVLLGFHANKFSDLLKTQIHKLQANSAHEGDLNIILVTGLSGGTGSGTVVSVASHILLQYPEAHVSIVAALPCFQAPPMHDIGYYHANAYAALRELNALNIGKLKSTDLVTGEQIQPTTNAFYERTGALFSLFLFDNFCQEYDRISNILLHNMKIKTSEGNSEAYLRSLEMCHELAPEYDFSTVNGDSPKPARTKAICALGLYRIVYPRKQILRHIAFNIERESYKQLLYNRYIENYGYNGEPSATIPVIEQLQLRKLGMDDAQLMLDIPIENENHQYTCFSDTWKNFSRIFGEMHELDTSSMIGEVKNGFEEYYQFRFRDKGVKNYFENREHLIEEHVNLLISNYEAQLLQFLMVGEKGVHEQARITEKLVENIRLRRQEISERRIVEADKEVERSSEAANEIIKQYMQANFLVKALKKKQFMDSLRHELIWLYTLKTELRAMQYEIHVLCNLESALAETLNKLMEIERRLIHNLENIPSLEHDEEKAPADTIYAIDWNRVEASERNLIQDKIAMTHLTALIRNKLILGDDNNLQRIIGVLRDDNLTKRILPTYYDFIKNYDIQRAGNQLFDMQETGDLLFETTLLQQLIKYQHDDKELTSIIRAALESVCDNISMNDNEVDRVVRNNLTPWENPASKPFTTLLVSIPKPTSAKESEISHKLSEIILLLCCNNMNICINCNYGNKDEIAIASVTTKFPLRYLNSLPELKNRYDQLIKDDRLQASCMLWTEDGFADLPSLEVEAFVEQPKSSTEEDDCSTDIFGFPLPPKTPSA